MRYIVWKRIAVNGVQLVGWSNDRAEADRIAERLGGWVEDTGARPPAMAAAG